MADGVFNMEVFRFEMFSLSIVLVLIVYLKFTDCLAPPYYGIDRPSFEYELPPLDFGFSELEPYIDEETVRVHYLGHHSKYTEKMNAALREWRAKDKLVSRKSIVDILRNLSAVPEKWRTSLKNNGGGFVNHNLYWSVLSPNVEGEERRPDGALAEDIAKTWDSYEKFKTAFTELAGDLFGSGYVWLCRNYTEGSKSSGLLLVTTSNQDSPVSQSLYPLLVIDVWEHAYYLKHKNQRVKYVDSWWKVVDWEAAARLDEWWRGAKLHDEL